MANSLFTELKRRSVFKVSAAYLVVSWLLIQVVDTLVPHMALPDWIPGFVIIALLVGFPIAIIFAWAFEITPQGVKLDSDIAPDDVVTAPANTKFSAIIIGLLVAALAYFIWASQFQTHSEEALAAERKIPDIAAETASNTDKVISLAVLPFVDMSKDKEQGYFVDGLTEELLNSLARVKGLKVTGRTSSFEFKDKNIDLREIASQLNVEYLVEGSVRKMGEDLRITVQLIEAENGSHILSDTFDRKLVNVFDLQEEISNQVAAALNLTLLLKDDRYNSALSTLDYLAVEKLVKARALIAEYAEAPSMEAYTTLVELNKRYPNTPEIMGLMIYAALIHSSTGGEVLSYDEVVEIGEQTLQLDRKNFDSLTVLAIYYKDLPQTHQLAKNMHKDLIRYYPAKAESYEKMMRFLRIIYSNCSMLEDFLRSVPEGVFEAKDRAQYDYMVMDCLTPALAEQKLSDLEDKTIADFSLSLTDAEFNFIGSKRRVAANPNQRFQYFYYYGLLAIGAVETAKTVATQIDYNTLSLWSVQASNIAYLNNVKAAKKPFDLVSFLKNYYGNYSHTHAVLALSKQALDDQRVDELKGYLNNVPSFQIGIETLAHAHGLMILQYFSGDEALSQATALSLYNVLSEYKAAHPESFSYWELGGYYLAAAFYSGNKDKAVSILEDDIGKDVNPWRGSYEGKTGSFKQTEFTLSPYKEHPVVIEYLKRIKESQQRMLAKFDLK